MNAALNWSLLMALVFATWMSPASSHAQSGDRYLIAQSDPDEAFDPFSDYSEFDEASDEEADINFFRHGRFFTVGLAAGNRSFTGNFSKTYGQSTAYGLYVTYFFDLRTAFSLGYITGDHAVAFTTNDFTKRYSGNVSLTTMNFDFKYFINTQNMTRGLADLNPYGLIGFAQYYRTYSLDNFEGSNSDATMGTDIGFGIEIPMMKKKSFLGVQATYHYVTFSDESKEFVAGNEKLDIKLSGDFVNLLFILGMNF